MVKPFRERNPVPIGIGFVAVLLAVLLLTFNLGRLPLLGGTTYTAAFADAAGLRAGDAVRVGGIQVGSVRGVDLQGTHVRVAFSVTNGQVHLGRATTASIQIFTLLGNKYLALAPAGGGTWPSGRELPLSATRTPYDVTAALQDLGRTTGQIDTHALATALDTLAATFRSSPPQVRALLSGLSRLSTTIASRDSALSSLLAHADAVTGVLAARSGDVTALLSQGDQLLAMLRARAQVVQQLLVNTQQLATQLSGLVHDDGATVGPLLAHLHSVVGLLNSYQGNLTTIIQGLYVFVRGEVSATGAGPWFDGTAINATNPFTLHAPAAATTAAPRTFADLLGLPALGAAP